MAEKKKKAENDEETQVDSAEAESTVEASVEDEAPEASEAPEGVEPEAVEPEVEIAAEAEASEAEKEAVEEPAAEEPAADAEPVAEADTAAEVAPAEPAAEADPVSEAGVARAEEADAEPPASAAGPKPKKKRLPRSLRPQRTKTARVKPATRKPIVRLEKPEHERGRRQERQGKVVSSAMDKTIVVKVDVLKAHPKYKKVVRRSTTFHAHDEANQASVGDIVRIVETRPLSKTKRWRLAEIVEAAK
jgi:small subunit ribosomal protein S17